MTEVKPDTDDKHLLALYLSRFQKGEFQLRDENFKLDIFWPLQLTWFLIKKVLRLVASLFARNKEVRKPAK